MVFLIFAAIGIFFAVPFETFGDGTEFAISSAVLGISHPPSYPLFIIISKFFYWLPFGNVAFRVNLFSALTAATTAFLVYKLYKGNYLDKLFLAIITFFSRTFFENAVTGEVYALNLLFFVAVIFLLEEQDDKRRFYFSSFLVGLGAGNHHTILFLTFYLLYNFLRNRKTLLLSDAAISVTLFLLGFSCYIYLPFRAINKPVWNWGNPANFELFINSFFRHDFQSDGLVRDVTTFLSQLITFNPINEFGLLGAVIAISSLILIFFSNKREFLRLITLIFLYSIFIIILLGNDKLTPEERKDTYAVFFIPAYFLLCYAVVIATKSVKKNIKFACYFLFLVSVLINQSGVLSDFMSFSSLAFPHDYAKAQLSIMPKNSVLIVTGGEKDFPVIYQQKIGNFRQDVKLINLAMLGRRWNFKDSLEAGATYTKGYEGETENKKQILKAIILFQKEFRNNRVLLNVFDEKELPDTLKYYVNGLFYETDDRHDLSLGYVRGRSLEDAPPAFKELLLAAKDSCYDKSGNQQESQKAASLLSRIKKR